MSWNFSFFIPMVSVKLIFELVCSHFPQSCTLNASMFMSAVIPGWIRRDPYACVPYK